jgi:hypothetical protein
MAGGMSKRLNITIPIPVYEVAREVADRYYEGNLSRMMADAAIYFAGRLEGKQAGEDSKKMA